MLTMAERELEASRRNLAEIEVRLADARRNLERNESLVKQQLISEIGARYLARRSERVGRAARSLQAQVKVAESGLAMRQNRLRRPAGARAVRGRGHLQGRAAGRDRSRRCRRAAVSRAPASPPSSTWIRAKWKSTSTRRTSIASRRISASKRRSTPIRTQPLAAHVINIVPTADRTKATVRVRIGFDKLEPQILPDMGIKVRFLDDAPVAAGAPTGPRIRVPSVAVQRVDGERLRLGGERRARRAPRGHRSGPRAKARSKCCAGVNCGDELVSPVVAGPRRRRQGRAQHEDSS